MRGDDCPKESEFYLFEDTNMKKTVIMLSCCALLAACNSTPQESPEQLSIQAVYKVDTDVISSSKTASEVVTKLQAIRLNGCPSAFVDAFRANIKSWEKLVLLEKRMYAVNMQKATSDMEKFISSYPSNASQAVVALKHEWPSFAEEIDKVASAITRTKTEYTSIGAKFNAVYKNPSLF